MYENDPVSIFLVEDDPAYSKFLQYVLSLNPDFEVTTFETGQDCIDNLHRKPAIISLDFSLPDINGDVVLEQIRGYDPDIKVIIVSAQEEVGTAVKLLKLGAYDYITKDEETKDLLLNAINNARKNISLTKEVEHLKEEISHQYDFKNIIGNSPAIKKVFSMLEKAAKTKITVSITGETGTGKELAAKAIHYHSSRKKQPFVPVNISAIPKDLIESELFGHEKGAFTGANTRRIGKFEQAEGGTIFLDEIGEMDMSLQAKLLRVLQEREVTRIGGNDIIKVDSRVIVATHRNLADEVKKGNFREDLYYRLLGLPVVMPPLRERSKDILLIAKSFLKAFCKENELPLLSFTPQAAEKLLSYGYPGNVRELKSIVELAAVMTDGDHIEEGSITFNSPSQEEELLNSEMTLKEYNNKIIDFFLSKYDNNVLEVARKLDIGKSTIYRYLNKDEE